MNFLFTSFRCSLLFSPNSHHNFLLHRFFSSSHRSFPAIPVEPLIQRLQSTDEHDSTSTELDQITVPDFSKSDLTTISNLLENTNVSPGLCLESALDETGVEPTVELVNALFDRLSSSPTLIHSVFKWAEMNPGFKVSPSLFDSVINALCKAREFEIAWSFIFDRGRSYEGSDLVSADTFIVKIRRYALAGMACNKLYELLNSLEVMNLFCKSASELKLLEVLLDTLCK